MVTITVRGDDDVASWVTKPNHAATKMMVMVMVMVMMMMMMNDNDDDDPRCSAWGTLYLVMLQPATLGNTSRYEHCFS